MSLGVNARTGEMWPATFPDKGPDMALRSATNFIGRKKVMTCRPRFNDWACQIEIVYDPSLIDKTALVIALTKAGDVVGLGDYRPLFGRFKGELI